MVTSWGAAEVALRSGSLRLRLLAAAACAVTIALAVSGYLLEGIFRDYVDARAIAELTNHANQLLAAIEQDASGGIEVTAAPADPRFATPHGGLYWQIDRAGRKPQRSRSLWETELVLPDDYLPDGVIHRHELNGPSGARLLALERGVKIGPATAPQAIRLAVALDRRETDEAVAAFRSVLMRSLAVLGFALLLALWLQVTIGLRPLDTVRTALERVHSGAQSRLEGAFPEEISPLVATMNALLDREQRGIERARENASNLAHGFKTPLTVLAAVARDLQRSGQSDAAGELETQLDIMGRHVQRELARARTRASVATSRKRVAVAPSVARIVKALERIGAGRELVWDIDLDPAATFPGSEDDLLELIGNIAGNAAKWAKSRIKIGGAQEGSSLTLRIDDDGPGIAEGSETEALVRGRRLDETQDGTGLGLAIVARLVEDYGGTLALSRSPLGGLAVRIVVPVPG